MLGRLAFAMVAVALGGLVGSAAGAGATPEPVVLVTYSKQGPLTQAPGLPSLAVYPDGRVVRLGRSQLEEGTLPPARMADLQAGIREVIAGGAPAAASCTTDATISTVTVRDTASSTSRSLRIAGLGTCDPRSATSRLYNTFQQARLVGAHAFQGPWVAYVRLADGVPASLVRPWRGAALVPGTWVAVQGGTFRTVRWGGHRFVLFPRQLLPHEQGAMAPGDVVASLDTRVAKGPRAALRAPEMSVRGDGTWYGRLADGSWQTGQLDPADLDAFDRQVQAAGFASLAASYTGAPGAPTTTTMTLGWGDTKRVVAPDLDRAVAAGALPPALGAAAAAFRGLRPPVVSPLEVDAVQVTWRPVGARAVPPGARRVRAPLKGARGRTLLIGRPARDLWAALAGRSWAGRLFLNGKPAELAVEPALET
ncbi:MAG TPA: hypothetical protein VKD47_03810 [Miltoncostaeaceae bacterium]|nr:hypothetical protein [Miltoncostaeaceae bacterium]